MTRPGKCSTCRDRKVKCDEQKPTCGACSKAARACRYLNNKFSHFVVDQSSCRSAPAPDTRPTSDPCGFSDSDQIGRPIRNLTLRSTRAADSGNGMFRTFGTARSKKTGANQKDIDETLSLTRPYRSITRSTSPSPSPALCTQESRLTARLMSMIATTELRRKGDNAMDMFGAFVRRAPLMMETSRLIYAATCSLVDSLTSYNSRNNENLALSQRSHTKVLQLLSGSLTQQGPQGMDSEVLLVTQMVFFVELILGPQNLNYTLHAAGLNNLLNHICQGGRQWDDISLSVYNSSYQRSLPQDVILERDSIFDTPTWLAIPAPEMTSDNLSAIGIARQTVMRIVVRMPRLLRLVREARRLPEDIEARICATALAYELHNLSLDWWIDDLHNAEILRTVSTLDPDVMDITPNAFRFDSTQLLALVLQYFEARALVCGCIDTLSQLPLLPGCLWPFDTLAVQREDLQTANNIAMSFEQLQQLSEICPVIDLRQVWPLQVACFTWCRVEKRRKMLLLPDQWSTDPVVTEAHKKQTQMMRLQKRWRKGWLPAPIGRPLLQIQAEMFSGGEIPVMKKRDHVEAAKPGSG